MDSHRFEETEKMNFMISLLVSNLFIILFSVSQTKIKINTPLYFVERIWCVLHSSLFRLLFFYNAADNQRCFYLMLHDVNVDFVALTQFPFHSDSTRDLLKYIGQKKLCGNLFLCRNKLPITFPKFTFCFEDDDPINWWIQFCRWLNQKWFQQIEIWNSIMWCDLLVNVIFYLLLCFFLVSPSVKASENGDSGWICLPSIHLTGAESSLSKAWVEMKATMPLPWFWIALAVFHNHFIHFHFHFGHSNSTTSDLLLTFPHEHLLPVIKL